MRVAVLVVVALAVGATVAASACRVSPSPRTTAAHRHPQVARRAAKIARGEATYAAYCAQCHGQRRDGQGELAALLDMHPADLRAPVLFTASDDDLAARLARGTPLRVPAGSASVGRRFEAEAVATYVAGLGTADWTVLRAGRIVYEESCAACHGPYGRVQGAVARWLGAPDLIAVRERISDASLARIANSGTGLMPPLHAEFDAAERRSLAAYVRHLSDGFRVYDTYCADCHGDDGAGPYTDALAPSATAAPPIAGSYPRAKLLHMLDRERGLMPHFRGVLDEERLRDTAAYLRAAARAATPGH